MSPIAYEIQYGLNWGNDKLIFRKYVMPRIMGNRTKQGDFNVSFIC